MAVLHKLRKEELNFNAETFLGRTCHKYNYNIQ